MRVGAWVWVGFILGRVRVRVLTLGVWSFWSWGRAGLTSMIRVP